MVFNYSITHVLHENNYGPVVFKVAFSHIRMKSHRETQTQSQRETHTVTERHTQSHEDTPVSRRHTHTVTETHTQSLGDTHSHREIHTQS